MLDQAAGNKTQEKDERYFIFQVKNSRKSYKSKYPYSWESPSSVLFQFEEEASINQYNIGLSIDPVVRTVTAPKYQSISPALISAAHILRLFLMPILKHNTLTQAVRAHPQFHTESTTTQPGREPVTPQSSMLSGTQTSPPRDYRVYKTCQSGTRRPKYGM